MYTQIDNWLEEDMVKFLDDKFTYDYPHYYG